MLDTILEKVRPGSRSEDETYEMIATTVHDFRAVASYVISKVKKPRVLLESRPVRDYSDSGPLQNKRMETAQDFEIRDGRNPVLGFHGGLKRLWFSNHYKELAEHCATQGWLSYGAE